jgi:hypothetical protein
MAYKAKSKIAASFPFLDTPVFIRPMPAAEKWEIESRMPRDPESGRFVNPDEYMAELVCAAVVDDGGFPIFTNAEIRKVDVEHLGIMWDAVSEFLGFNQTTAKKN